VQQEDFAAIEAAFPKLRKRSVCPEEAAALWFRYQRDSRMLRSRYTGRQSEVV